MYALIWRILPGPKWLKAVESLLLLVAVIAALFTWVFPWLANTFPIFDNTVG
ncbi:MAG: hypothetical protein Q3979_10250 [Actinomycetaceae bacterium]|nr:hypothetical protein [Actinomycetaceae bacterium]